MNLKLEKKQTKSFSLIGSPLKSARRMLGLEREYAKKMKYAEETPDALRAGEFPVVNLDNDPIAQLVNKL